MNERKLSKKEFDELLREGYKVRKKVQEEFAPLVNITQEDLRMVLK